MGGSSTQAPETGTYGTTPNRIWQATWTDTLTSRMLFEFGYSAYNNRWGGGSAPGNPTRDFIQVREQGGCDSRTLLPCDQHAVRRWIPDLHRMDFGEHLARQPLVRHRLAQHEVRLQRALRLRQPGLELRQSQGLVYQFNNGVPNQFWELSGQFKSQWRTRYDAFFAQDSWTRNRLTLQGAVRYEHAWSYYPESYIGGTRFFPTFTTIPESQGRQLQQRDAARRRSPTTCSATAEPR